MEFENEIYTGSDTMIGDDGFIIPKGPGSTDNLLFVSSGDGWIAYKFDISQLSCLFSSDHIMINRLLIFFGIKD